MRLNKKENIILMIGIVVLLVGIFVLNNQSKETKELPQVKLKEKENNKQFALMIEQTKGEGDYEDGSEEYTDAFPTEGYRFNESMSGCIDINGQEIENALEYDYDNYTITVNTNKTAYCYLYYDIYEKTITPLELVASNPQGLTQQPLVGGMHRYQGTDNVANWIIFGTTEKCNKDEGEKCTNSKLGEMTYAEYVDKYMYRIIGITEEGQLYLLKETFLKERSVTGFAWNNKYSIDSSSSYYCPDGICPEWNEADLFKRINGTSNGTTAGAGSSSSTRSDTDIFVDNEYYDYLKSGDENGGEEASEWYNLIDNHDWYYGDTTSTSYNGDTLYNIETGKSETTHYAGTYGSVTGQSYTWTNTVNAKISLMYLHDYAYAYPGGNPNNYTNVANSWIHYEKDGYNTARYEWLSTRWGIISASNTNVGARNVHHNGNLSYYPYLYNSDLGARPVFYLLSIVSLTGEGTKDSPFIISNL